MRTALTLQEKNLVKIHAELQTVIKLTSEGETHAKNGLPERRLVNAVMALGGKAVLDKAAEKAGLEKQFIQIALGWTQRKKWLPYDSKTNTAKHLDFQPAMKNASTKNYPKQRLDCQRLEQLDHKQIERRRKSSRSNPQETATPNHSRQNHTNPRNHRRRQNSTAKKHENNSKKSRSSRQNSSSQANGKPPNSKNTTSKHQSPKLGLEKSILTSLFSKKSAKNLSNSASKK